MGINWLQKSAQFFDDPLNDNVPWMKTLENFRRKKDEGDPYWRHAELVPVRVLNRFMDIDRETYEHRIPEELHRLPALTENVAQNGFTDIAILFYNPEFRTLFLGEGNHRLAVAKRLGIPAIPARVYRTTMKTSPASNRPGAPVEGFEPNEFGYVPADLLPSQIGLKVHEASVSNWFVRIGAYWDKEPVIADPVEMGYKEEWGEHHGPVSYVPDTWNYGPKGYYSPPIPMPKKLYHASPYVDTIMDEGFKLPKELGRQTFGGSEDFMSFTSLNNALSYQAVIQDLVKVANGFVDEMQPLEVFQYFAEKWKVPQDALDSFISGTGREADSPRKAAMLFFGYIHNYGGAKHVPFIFGNSNLLDHFVGLNPDDVGVVEVETQPLEWHTGTNIWHDTDMSNHYTYNRYENEWRIYDSQAIQPVRRVA